MGFGVPQSRLMAMKRQPNGAAGRRTLPHTSEPVTSAFPEPRPASPRPRGSSTVPEGPTATPQLPQPLPCQSRPRKPTQVGGAESCTPHLLAVHRLLSWGLPAPCHQFLWRLPGQFPVTAFLLGAGTGGLLAIGLFQLLVNPMDIYEEQKMVAIYGLVGQCLQGRLQPPSLGCWEGIRAWFLCGVSLLLASRGRSRGKRPNIRRHLPVLGLRESPQREGLPTATWDSANPISLLTPLSSELLAFPSPPEKMVHSFIQHH
ncbi:Hypothetical predicted protein [Marmota monax]|uniref:Uncharacterized protein n=1 Tax=Marmota monax TaxID=9995 RepID=A0A5E4A7N2_MARMO|nr:Hypothetical predicted protein [Marmota monax]